MSGTTNNNVTNKELVPFNTQTNTKTKKQKIKNTNVNAYTLPGELLQKIFSLLSPKDLCQISRVSRTWRALSDANPVWIYPCTRDGFISSIKEVEGSIEVTYKGKPYSIENTKTFNAKDIYKRGSKATRTKNRKTHKAEEQNRKRIEKAYANNKDNLFFQLPTEIVQLILGQLSPHALRNLSQTCFVLRSITDDNHVWIYPCAREGFLILQQEDDQLKIEYNEQKFFLQDLETQNKAFNAKAVFHEQMQKRIESVIEDLLSPYKKRIGQTTFNKLELTLQSPSLYDTESKEEQIYDSLKALSEALVPKTEGLSKTKRQTLEKSLRFALACKTQDPTIVAAVIKRDHSPQLLNKKTCNALDLDTPQEYVIGSDDLDLFQILSDLNFKPTKKDLRLAIRLPSPKIAEKLIEAVRIEAGFLYKAWAVLGVASEEILDTNKKIEKKQQEIEKVQKKIKDNEKETKEPNTPKKLLRALAEQNKALKKLELALQSEIQTLQKMQQLQQKDLKQQIRIMLLLLEKVAAQGNEAITNNADLAFDEIRSQMLWNGIISTKDLPLIKKTSAVLGHSEQGLKGAFGTCDSDIVNFLLEEQINLAKKKGALQSLEDEFDLRRLWEPALETKDLEIIKKMEQAFVHPDELLILACLYSGLDIVSHLITQANLEVTFRCFNGALSSGNKELFDFLLENYRDRFNPNDHKFGSAAIEGNNIELVRTLLDLGVCFSIKDLIDLSNDEPGNQILELLVKENKISFEVSKPGTISWLAKTKNPQLLSLLCEKGIIGKGKSKMVKQARKAITQFRPTRRGVAQTADAVHNIRKLAKSSSKALDDQLEKWKNEYKKNKKSLEDSEKYKQAIERVKILLQTVTMDDRCNRVIFKSSDFKMIYAAIVDLDLPIPKNVYQYIFTKTVRNSEELSKKDLQRLQDIHAYFSSKGIKPAKKDIKILENAIQHNKKAIKENKKDSSSDSSDSSDSSSSDDEETKTLKLQRLQERREKDIGRLEQVLTIVNESGSTDNSTKKEGKRTK